MSFGQSISTCFSKSATFTGRASRSEFWWFYLLYVIVASAANFTDMYILNSNYILTAIVVLAFILPVLAASARRLHDTSKSGWMLLLGLIPCVGGIVLLVFFVQAPTPADNQYGPGPTA